MDVYERVTSTIVAAIEANPDKMQMPWQRFSEMPQNAFTGADYNGVNIVTLWCEAQLHGYDQPVWASYKQWQEKGAQVRKGEKSSVIVFFKQVVKQEDGEDTIIPILKWSSVFNASQVDGYEPPKTDRPPLARLEHVEEFVEGVGAVVNEGGGRACYIPSRDVICMPEGTRFFDTKTRSRTEAYYSILMHELTHWSGAEHRLNRQLKNRFGDEAYAMEELVAELGAAFLCSRLSITPEVREDHSQYINNWLDALKRDKKAIFTAAAKAQEAVKFLTETDDGLQSDS